MTTEVRLVGEGGAVWTFELPLSEVFADQVKSHKLRPADEDSTAAVADLLADPEAAAADGGSETPQGAGEPPAEVTLADRIAAVGTHDEANALAAELGVEGFEAKKPALDAKRAALLEKAAAADSGSETP